MGKGEEYRISSMKNRIYNLLADSTHFYSAVQSQTVDYAIPGTKIERKNAVGDKYKLVFEPAQVGLTGDDYKKAVNRTHCYTQTTIDMPASESHKAGRHAICAYKSSGKIFGIGSHLYVFDPNYGEFRVPTDKIEYFFRSLRETYGGEFNAVGTYKVTTK